ncbi:CinA family nicotinamide mononucleotide deamidase-related protein [Candidatus Fermentibacteria bacterium]|nr:CinA family nicotinamide mononucleotide deamidase-related protein [Candidatus Fermentibacteria bacterium]
MSGSRRARAEIIVVGTELLQGYRADRHVPFLTVELRRAGLDVRRATVVPDQRQCVAASVALALDSDATVVIVCGGVGPTPDDVTKDAVADALGTTLKMDDNAREEIRRRASVFGDVSPDAVDRQAMVVPGARLLTNHVGVAPGLAVSRGSATVYLLPGPPAELRDMFLRYVGPEIRRTASPGWVAMIRTASLREVTVAEMVSDALGLGQRVTAAYLPAPGIVDVLLSANSKRTLASAVAKVRKRLGCRIYSENGGELEEVVGALLTARGNSLVTAESCTGGLVAQLLTSIPGSSRYVLGGVVAYSNGLKERLLGVPGDMLRRHGAVSAEVASAMAEGARERLGGDWAISVTGIAGPDGGTEDKPVGLVLHGLAGPGGVDVARHVLGGDRAAVRMASARLALDFLRGRLMVS